ncbi:MAG: S49 family peptidase [Natronospirillum sp.]|uniref:S49 family peptidase n=1 Tax=Natronospirillum sp. TaxID=2812955 RepID=UPI0025FB2BE5|nr:S49 family peptidase [Natronospirillum sp.]MCH8552354.1 S49 family peptidase [Natronospirillum sp.]
MSLPLRAFRLRLSFALPVALLVSAPAATAEDIGFQRHYDRNEFALTAPGAQKFGLYGYDNPAQLHYLQAPDLTLSWTADEFADDDQRFNVNLAAPGIGFAFDRDRRTGSRVDHYHISVGGGSDEAASGLGIGWYRGDTGTADLRTHFTLGTITRPSRQFSVGVTGRVSTGFDYYEAVADAAWRPFGTPTLALFGDYVWGDADSRLAGDWSGGVSSEFLPGVQVAGRYFDGGTITAGVQFSFGNSGVSYQRHVPDSADDYNSYAVRLGARERNVFDEYFTSHNRYLNLDLDDRIAYQRFALFDRRKALYDKLEYIDAARQDDSINGILVNATNMTASPSMAWEIMDSLQRFREEGKRVVLYIENGGMTELHMMSAADYVVMDPAGTLFIPGLVSGSTYLGDLLAFLGIGIDEIREMEYKSALESLARSDMSDADREQRQSLIDDFYERIRADVVANRDITTDDFDRLIDRGVHLAPRDLVEAGLVDRLTRYPRMDNVLRELERRPQQRTSPAGLMTFQTPQDDQWGPRPAISVIYATGPTDTDRGMRARTVARALRQARNDSSVAAVVLRVDSPGGGILAADMVAEEVRRTRDIKPVIVSMGNYATSGGYWVAAYATDILATPLTTTGSIGVISARLWDDGLSERLNLRSDAVQRGASADIGFGVTVPLIGLSLPARPYTEVEREAAVDRLNQHYEHFIALVADGRDMSRDEVRAVAGGRIHSGGQALELGLVDGMGSLWDAIELAKARAGIEPGRKFEVRQGPNMQVSSLMDLLELVGEDEPMIMPFQGRDSYAEYFEHLIEHRGQPQVIIPYRLLEQE